MFGETRPDREHDVEVKVKDFSETHVEKGKDFVYGGANGGMLSGIRVDADQIEEVLGEAGVKFDPDDLADDTVVAEVWTGDDGREVEHVDWLDPEER